MCRERESGVVVRTAHLLNVFLGMVSDFEMMRRVLSEGRNYADAVLLFFSAERASREVRDCRAAAFVVSIILRKLRRRVI